MERDEHKLIALITKRIVNYQNKVDQTYKIHEITGKAFEVFYEMSPDLDYSKLDDKEFCDEFIEKVRAALRKEITFVPDPPDPPEGEETGFGKEPADPIDPITEIIKTPLDFEEGNPKLAILLIENFFSLPVIEKEAYKVRIKKKEIHRQINHLKNQVQIIKGDERLTNETKKENIDINELEADIKELEENLNDVSPILELFSETGILAFQRRAFIRIKYQWKQIKESVNKQVLNNTEDYIS